MFSSIRWWVDYRCSHSCCYSAAVLLLSVPPSLGPSDNDFWDKIEILTISWCILAAILLLSPLLSCCYSAAISVVIHSSCYSAAIASLMCYVASVRPCRIRITPKSWNRKWPQVKLRSELTISEQCSENISHKHAFSYKKQRPALREHIFCFLP